MRQLYAGFDLGGTKLLCGLSDGEGRLAIKERIQIDHSRDVKGVVISYLQKFRDYCTKNGCALHASGMGVPGVCDGERIYLNTNLKNIDLRGIRDEAAQMGVGMQIMNDVRCALLGERWLGAAKGSGDFIYMNLGTGLSCAFISGGRMIRGINNAAGETAYMLSNSLIREGIGTDGVFDPDEGSLEKRIAGRALDHMAKKMYAGQEGEASARLLFERAKDKHRESMTAVDSFIEELATAVVQMSAILNPEMVVFGGSVSGNFDLFWPKIEAYLMRYLPYPPMLKRSALGSDSGLLGSIYMAIQGTTDL
jgi:glucokinase